MKPICVPCQRFYSAEENGQWFIEAMPIGVRVRPGKSDAERWKPYKLWMGDRWKCHGCGHEIISGVGLHPVKEHYMPDFAEWAKRSTFQVNDC